MFNEKEAPLVISLSTVLFLIGKFAMAATAIIATYSLAKPVFSQAEAPPICALEVPCGNGLFIAFVGQPPHTFTAEVKMSDGQKLAFSCADDAGHFTGNGCIGGLPIDAMTPDELTVTVTWERGTKLRYSNLFIPSRLKLPVTVAARDCKSR